MIRCHHLKDYFKMLIKGFAYREGDLKGYFLRMIFSHIDYSIDCYFLRKERNARHKCKMK